MIFETHGHYDDEQFDTDREQLLEEFQRMFPKRCRSTGSESSWSWQKN